MLFLRWIGWGVAFAAVVAFSLITTITCFNFGKMSALFSSDPDRNAVIFAAVDIAKMVLPVGIVWCWAKAHYAACAASVIAFVVFLSASLFAAFGISANVASSKEAGAVIASSRLSGLQAQLQRLTPELAALGTPRPVDQIAADIARHKINDKWAASSGCDERKIVGGTLNFCRDYQKLFAELAGANRATELRKDIAGIEAKITDGTTEQSLMPANPATAALAKLIDIDPAKINATWSIAIALALEAVSAFLPSAAWHARPTLPEQSGAARPGAAQDATRRAGNRTAGYVPIAADTAPQTPPLKGRPYRGDGYTKRESNQRPGDVQSRPRLTVIQGDRAGQGDIRGGAFGYEDEDVMQFVAARVPVERNRDFPARYLLDAYAEWCAENGKTPVGVHRFAAALQANGFRKRKSNGKSLYRDRREVMFAQAS